MKLSAVAPVILGLLSRRPRSGYEIKAVVDRSTRFFWAASYGQIYPELRRLEDAGLVAGEERPTGGRPRTVYRLTEPGRETLREWLRAPDVGAELRDLGLLKLFFAHALERGEAIELVRRIRRDREHVLERLRAVESNPSRPRGGFGETVLSYGLEKYEWQVDWWQRLERRLEAEPPATSEEGVA